MRCVALGRVLLTAAAVASSEGAAAQTSSQIGNSGWSESPPWGSTARSLSLRSSQPSGGGIVPPFTYGRQSPLSQPPVRPVVSAWQQDARPRTISLDDAGRFATRPPAIGQRRVVSFAANYHAGAIVIVNRERALYHVQPDGKAVRYAVAIGSYAEEWTGVEFVTDKKAYPTWYPVQEPGRELREPVLGGDPANPLGVRALYLGRTLWRIHGTPSVDSIGHAVSNGCIRMHNDHVSELFDSVMLGTEVYVVDRLSDPAPAYRGRKVIELSHAP